MSKQQTSVKPRERKLTSKQLFFARCVASGLSHTAAYREAYDVRPDSKGSTHNEQASRLAHDPRIAARIDSIVRQKELAITRIAVSDRERVLGRLRTLTDTATTADMAVLRALELLGRSCSLFTDVIEERKTRTSEEVAQEIADRLEQLRDKDDIPEPDEDLAVQ